ncbi:DmsE family decaheme c-type cytochrome [Pelotalea chapellei]|uniref:DmsE family decaheme c-type cytochrome n=1 Tax=Pelotalea chapellei TaxID=44671 RepID=A0ABS5U965_9BACT|nr:DmsE family decaheme c-type cytochrome [Pelotalea chapellei]MBT1072221.1 DmsE family decaheme c-type cytochrome [Pelotalea chapellei]
MHISIVPVLIAMLVVSACTALKEGYPLLPVSEYEKMVVGRLDADYVGTDNCVAKCHKHDKLTNDFKLSVHGEQITPQTGLPLVNCESCHGPGSLAIDKIEKNRQLLGEAGDKCDFSKLLDLKTLPPQAQSLICLKCHSAASTPALAQWHTSVHALNDLSCFDCHKLHEGPHQKVSRDKMAELCYGCHPDVKAQFSLFSRHPVREKKMGCFDCHEPHGSSLPALLKGNSQRDMCTRCHMEKSGPFVYEHGDVTETCTNCHAPHGSVNRRLLAAAMPFLCIQCHSPGHRNILDDKTKPLFANRCTDCHSTIHGSDTPDNRGFGTLRK